MTILLSALQWFGGTVVVVGLIGIATWQLFKWLGSKWIEDQFQHRMEAYKAEQLRELERLRAKINQTFDRTKRLHDKEFEHLPDIWGRLVDAFEKTAAYLSPLREYYQIKDIHEEELEPILKERGFSDTDIAAIRRNDDPQKLYEYIFEFIAYREVIAKTNDFAFAFRKNGIFLEHSIKEKFDAYFKMMRSAILQKHFAMAGNVLPRPTDKVDHFNQDGPALFKEIEDGVQERLWDSAITQV